MGRWIGSMLAGLTVSLMQLVTVPVLVSVPVHASTCVRADFEAVVDEAAAALRDLNLNNRPAFQEKLRNLKEMRGWSYDEFMKGAVPFVRDDKIEVYDQSSGELLDQISRLGQEGAEATKQDCALLEDLRSRMKKLVEILTAKWSYMFTKLEAELNK